MRFIPHTDDDITSMLAAIGLASLDDLFSSIPAECRSREPLNISEAVTEWELNDFMEKLSASMASTPEYKIFVGAGSYDHFIPETVPFLLGRSEFVTSYTPYQPELSQGTLQAIYEYQTLTARLLGMEIANASMYDGASALAEALLMAIRVTGKKQAAISTLIHPHYRRVVRTYFEPAGYELIELPYLENGTTDISPVSKIDDLAAVAVQSPNFFGCIEQLAGAAKAAHDRQALLVVSFTEPLAYGLYKSPGSQGADIACGEGQSLGIPRSFGGPGVGMFASKMDYVRQMPGRLVGKTIDAKDRRGFVLTLATREQHIRRGKATSNICTNNSLCAVAASMYMASLGAGGFRDLARLNYDKAEYLKNLFKTARFKVPFSSLTFNEFVVEFPPNFEVIHRRLMEQKIIAGLPLETYYPELANHYLICVTETITRDDMDTLVREVKS
ncbi:MAG: aminomethyl-transferring glycine dehydrogenase subunit GcvPA [Deltaproteobacteria bacterium]|nr:aminomethyl-transferring glycine dehydrogenase subunit GcvPA [Deltaproteobacteria bacterium]